MTEKLAMATHYKRKYVRKPIFANLGTRVFKNGMLPPEETNISKLRIALYIFIRLSPF